jgi:hypothetical protein
LKNFDCPVTVTDNVDSEAGVVIVFHNDANVSSHFCCASLQHENISNS